MSHAATSISGIINYFYNYSASRACVQRIQYETIKFSNRSATAFRFDSPPEYASDSNNTTVIK